MIAPIKKTNSINKNKFNINNNTKIITNIKQKIKKTFQM